MDSPRIPLLLLPGSLCEADMWNAQIDALGDIADARTVEIGGFDSIAAMAAHVIAEAPEGRFALAGFSLGGYVALEVVRRVPERISHLALLDTSARPDHPENAPRREANMAAFRADPYPVLDAFKAMTLGPATPPEVREAIRTSMRRLGPFDYLDQQRAIMQRPDARPTLSAIGCPTLVLCGGEDRATPPAGHREIAAAVPGAAYVELPGIGHMTPLEAPESVAGAMREWLSGAMSEAG